MLGNGQGPKKTTERVKGATEIAAEGAEKAIANLKRIASTDYAKLSDKEKIMKKLMEFELHADCIDVLPTEALNSIKATATTEYIRKLTSAAGINLEGEELKKKNRNESTGIFGLLCSAIMDSDFVKGGNKKALVAKFRKDYDANFSGAINELVYALVKMRDKPEQQEKDIEQYLSKPVNATSAAPAKSVKPTQLPTKHAGMLPTVSQLQFSSKEEETKYYIKQKEEQKAARAKKLTSNELKKGTEDYYQARCERLGFTSAVKMCTADVIEKARTTDPKIAFIEHTIELRNAFKAGQKEAVINSLKEAMSDLGLDTKKLPNEKSLTIDDINKTMDSISEEVITKRGVNRLHSYSSSSISTPATTPSPSFDEKKPMVGKDETKPMVGKLDPNRYNPTKKGR